ncbi:MAG: hypothetical protein A2014_00355 [Spirochaetes bacterium GWF1_49_6]|nr:MAG: hypothetical protein A2014_00355 [Spirochaetes bacterium GWF1_49_6]
MKMIKYVIFLTVIFSFRNLYAVKPYSEQMSNFSAAVSVTVIPNTNFTEYKYEIVYSQNNPRDLFALSFNFPPQIVESEFLNAEGLAEDGVKWNGSYGNFGNLSIINFGAKGGTLSREWINSNMILQKYSANLKPGQKLLISIKVSGKQTIPGIINLEGYCNAAHWVFNTKKDGYPDKTYDTGVHPKIFKVVGPMLKPAGNTGMIDKLIELTTGSYDLQWISKMDVYLGLMDKLNAAKQQILQGQSKYHTAWNILEAYKHLLNAQRWKAITEPCFQMLYFNADLLISKLK